MIDPPSSSPLSDDALFSEQLEQEMPSSKELFEFLKDFLTRRCNLPAEPVNWEPEGLADLPLEKSILFSEPFPGLLAVRSDRRFDDFLEESAHSGKLPPVRRDVFLEMTVLIWHFFIQKFWKLDSRKITPASIQSSVPIQWPDRQPQSACMAFVKSHPFEMRLWNRLTEEEIRRWKKKNLTRISPISGDKTLKSCRSFFFFVKIIPSYSKTGQSHWPFQPLKPLNT